MGGRLPKGCGQSQGWVCTATERCCLGWILGAEHGHLKWEASTQGLNPLDKETYCT